MPVAAAAEELAADRTAAVEDPGIIKAIWREDFRARFEQRRLLIHSVK
jgi:hypothetical protein